MFSLYLDLLLTILLPFSDPYSVLSVGRHYLSSVLFASVCWILSGSHVHITLLPHVRQQQVLCVQKKGLSFSLFAVAAVSDVFF